LLCNYIFAGKKDAFGTALRDGFQQAASEANIEVASVSIPFQLDAASSRSDIRDSLSKLRDTNYRYIYAIIFQQHLLPVFTEAVDMDLVRSDYFYLFPSLEVAANQQRTVYNTGTYPTNRESDLSILVYKS
jgi:hypothetical protein